ncbi:MAG: 4Fe-4S dicluster domain-containing protein [Candidatus Omnitrophica bacterium]|nr:4Fe-4S dicluster domain-containing protein [Candidatus Omnitrophota bacterium]MBU1933514.1 4Fe-4S dicluster domain-containing protein [Candidatus Omnitrophota bacterium]
MDIYFINRPNLDRLIKSLSKTYKVYAPVKSEGNRYYKKVGDEGLGEATLGEIRPVQSIKSFFLPVRTKVSDYFSEDLPGKKSRPVAIVGVKSCDLASLKVMDYVFKQDSFKDPFYIQRREEGLIISSDCTCYGESCFCVALGIMPYPTEDFDINLSEIESGYVAEIGSEKGGKIIKEYFKLFQKAELYKDKKEENRGRLKEELLAHVRDKMIPAKDSLQPLFRKKFDSELWEETVKTCVECGACNVICPACHCFVLKDQGRGDDFERLRLWDSCLLRSFAVMAGGANPRKLLAQRLRNRFDKKFNFFPDVIGKFGCTGCGRCSDACPGKIRIDEVLSKFES